MPHPKTRKLLAPLALTCLVACGSGVNTELPQPEVNPNLFEPQSIRLERTSQIGVKPVYDETNDTITSGSNDQITIGLDAGQRAFDGTPFKLYTGDYIETLGNGFLTLTNPIETIRGTTASGSGVTTIFSSPVRVGGGYAGFERLGSTEMPTSGTATYAGDYIGTFDAIERFKGLTYVKGAVTLEADFAGANVSGRITDRIDTGGDLFTDITLESAAIADGGFQGDISGGLIIADDFIKPFDTVYQGLFVGANAEEVVGGLTLRHQNQVLDEFGDETGMFILD